MEMPRRHGYLLVQDFRAANPQVELVPWSIPDLEFIVSRFGGALAFLSWEILQGF